MPLNILVTFFLPIRLLFHCFFSTVFHSSSASAAAALIYLRSGRFWQAFIRSSRSQSLELSLRHARFHAVRYFVFIAILMLDLSDCAQSGCAVKGGKNGERKANYFSWQYSAHYTCSAPAESNVNLQSEMSTQNMHYGAGNITSISSRRRCRRCSQ